MCLQPDPFRDRPYSLKGASRPLHSLITTVKISPDGKHVAFGLVAPYVLSTSWDKLQESGKDVSWPEIDVCIHRGHAAGINCLDWSLRADRIVSGSDDMKAIAWDLDSPLPTLVMRGHRQPITSIAYVPNSRTIVTSSLDRSLIFWSSYSGILLHENTSHRTPITMMGVDRFGKNMGTGTLDGMTRCISIKDEVVLGTYLRADQHRIRPVIGAGVTPNGEYAWSIHTDGWLEMYEVSTKEPVMAVHVELGASNARHARFVGNAMLVSTDYGIAVIDVLRRELVEKEFFEGGITSFDVWAPENGFGSDAEELRLCLARNDIIYTRTWDDLSVNTQHAIQRTSLDVP